MGSPAKEGIVFIRTATEEDLPAIVEIYNCAVAETTATADYEPTTLEARLAWFHQRIAAGFPVFVAVEDDVVRGWGALNPYNPRPGYRFTAEDSVYVDHDYIGRGMGRALLSRLVDAARAMGLRTLIASIDGSNKASLHLHRSFAFVESGRYPNMITKFDQWLDVVHLQLSLW